jgi:hypothetical protein
MKEIPLSQGKVAIVDDDMFEELSKFKWYFNKGYAVRQTPGRHIDRKKICMHREIIRTPDDLETDHINHNTLDNRRENLRICTVAENQHNQNIQKMNTSGYKGITWIPSYQKWKAMIRVNNKRVFLGYFKSSVDAAKAYDEAAKKLHGEFAKTNF